MKYLMFCTVLLLSVTTFYGQDIITFKNGSTIQAKVYEVGVSQVKYYRADNSSGPVYVAEKSAIAQVLYQNGSKDIFTGEQQVTDNTPGVIIIEQPGYTNYRRPVIGLRLSRFPSIGLSFNSGHRNTHHYRRHH